MFSLPRRGFLILAALPLAACKRPPRCASCGMVLDPSSRWYAEIELHGQLQGFDTPKCALRHLLGKGPRGTLLVRGYYEQQRMPGAALLFVEGSDVLGPMGADLVPVEPRLEPKFRAEHQARRSYRLDQLTLAIVEGI